MLRYFNAMLGFLVILYPLAVYLGIHVLVPWEISAVLMVALLLRFCLFPVNKQMNSFLIGAGVLYCIFAIGHNSEISLRFYPVWINFCLFGLFLFSLFYPPSIIERFARSQHPNLSHQGILYTRKVTTIWCLFFVLNGMVAAGTALWSDFFWWSLYNGFIAYVLMGILMSIEYLIRIRMQLHDH